MSRAREILKHVRVFSSSHVLSQWVTLIASVLMRRFLGPVNTGIWSVLQIILIYSSYATLGVQKALSREVAFHRGRGDQVEADEIKNIVASYVLLSSGLMAAGLMVYALVWGQHLKPELAFGIAFTGLLVILQRANNLVIDLARSIRLFPLLARQTFYSAVVNAFLVGVLSYRFQIYGYLWAMALSFAFNIVYLLGHHPYAFKWRWNPAKLKMIMGFGFPLMVIGFFLSTFLALDRMVIAKFLSIEALGIYSVAVMTQSYLAQIPNSIVMVVIPHFHEKFGKEGDASNLYGMLIKTQTLFRCLMTLGIGMAWIWMPTVVEWLLPAFASSKEALRFLILGTYLMVLADFCEPILVSVKRHLWTLPVVAGTVFLTWGLMILGLRWQSSIATVAVCMVIGHAFRYVGSHLTACAALGHLREGMAVGLKTLSGFILMSATLFGIEAVLVYLRSGTATRLAAETVLWILFCLPSIRWVMRRGFEARQQEGKVANVHAAG